MITLIITMPVIVLLCVPFNTTHKNRPTESREIHRDWMYHQIVVHRMYYHTSHQRRLWSSSSSASWWGAVAVVVNGNGGCCGCGTALLYIIMGMEDSYYMNMWSLSIYLSVLPTSATNDCYYYYYHSLLLYRYKSMVNMGSWVDIPPFHVYRKYRIYDNNNNSTIVIVIIII